MSKLLLITENSDIIIKFESKLALLRATDSVSYCNYEDAEGYISKGNFDVVIIHATADLKAVLNLVKFGVEKSSKVLLMIDEYKRDLVLSAYDIGISDYFSVKSDASEILIRIINCLKAESLEQENLRMKKYLTEYKIIGNNGFISSKYAKEIFEFEIKSFKSNGVFMVVAPDEEGKLAYLEDEMSDAIKKSVRFGDIVANSNGAKFYIMLANSNTCGAKSVFEKIKENLRNKFSIMAGICEIKTTDLTELERQANCALAEAGIDNKEISIYAKKNETLDEWLEIPEKTEKNYKLFNQMFNKKLEKVITPVFFRLQKSWEEKLFDTKITQFTDDLQSIFSLKHPKQESKLKIVYPGFNKIVIYIAHSGLDSPENKEISLPINKITQKELVQIIEEFINEFKSAVS